MQVHLYEIYSHINCRHMICFTGLLGGKFLKNRQNQATEMELNNLSVKKSSSLPDFGSSSNKSTGWFQQR